MLPIALLEQACTALLAAAALAPTLGPRQSARARPSRAEGARAAVSPALAAAVAVGAAMQPAQHHLQLPQHWAHAPMIPGEEFGEAPAQRAASSRRGGESSALASALLLGRAPRGSTVGRVRRRTCRCLAFPFSFGKGGMGYYDGRSPPSSMLGARPLRVLLVSLLLSLPDARCPGSVLSIIGGRLSRLASLLCA